MTLVLPWRPSLSGCRPLSVPWVAGLAVALLTFALYLFTLAPSVTLEDSGEYITSATTLGVSHPPGYPLWVTLSHLVISLLPFGNVAWKVNLVSALFGALANGLVAALVAHSTRWLLDGKEENDLRAGFPGWLLPLAAGLAAGLSLGCSDVMWSQSVIVEVYTLNACFLLGTLWLFYRWVREPRRTNFLLGAASVYALGLTNHHSLLFILPVFPLLVWLVRRDFLPTFLAALFLFSLSAGAFLVWFSDDPVLETIIQRLACLLLAVVSALALWQRDGRWRGAAVGALAGALIALAASTLVQGWFRIETPTGWLLAAGMAVTGGLIGFSALRRRFIAAFLVLAWIGLMPYGLERLYSSTNPPMNWGYAQTKSGFFYAVSRGQYVNNLSSLLEKTFGPPLGVFPPSAPDEGAQPPLPAVGRAYLVGESVWKAVGYYLEYLQDNFSLPLCLIAFFAFFLFGKLPREQRRWLLFLAAAFVMLSFFLTVIDPPEALDRATHLVRRRFYLPAHCLFALALGYGVAGGLLGLRRYAPALPLWACGLAPLLAAFPLALNYEASEQRGHWFGWQYGTDMLRPLDKGAVLFGGTDPGRFIPTYMIFCESRQPARWKRDPSFDRSDLYILTQNALADYFYMRTLIDQYDTTRRRKSYGPLERRLGRDSAYPRDGLALPTPEEFSDAFKKVEGDAGKGGRISDAASIFEINSNLARLVFEKNKARHTFYVEESFPIPWMYPYLVPEGLILRLNPDPLPTLPPEAVRHDREFWDAYSAKLLADPKFLRDRDARNAFAKLRLSIAGLYAARRLDDEALYAFRQALALGPDNYEVVRRMTDFAISIGRGQEAAPYVAEAQAYDPENSQIHGAALRLALDTQLREEEATQQAALAADAADLDASRKLVRIFLLERRFDDAIALLDRRPPATPPSIEELVSALTILQRLGQPEATERLLQHQLQIRPRDSFLLYQLASLYAQERRAAEAFRLLARAVAEGGDKLRSSVPGDPNWAAYRDDPAFRSILAPPPSKARK